MKEDDQEVGLLWMTQKLSRMARLAVKAGPLIGLGRQEAGRRQKAPGGWAGHCQRWNPSAGQTGDWRHRTPLEVRLEACNVDGAPLDTTNMAGMCDQRPMVGDLS